MAKKQTHKATAKRPAASNPTSTGKKKSFKRRHNPTGFASKMKGLDLANILVEGAGVAAGSLASSFVSRQAARMLPDMNPALRTGLSTLLVTGGLVFLGGHKGFVRNMAVGAAANGVTGVLGSLMPGLFAGGEINGLGGLGGWSPADGTWNEDVGGVLFDAAGEPPEVRSF